MADLWKKFRTCQRRQSATCVKIGIFSIFRRVTSKISLHIVINVLFLTFSQAVMFLKESSCTYLRINVDLETGSDVILRHFHCKSHLRSFFGSARKNWGLACHLTEIQCIISTFRLSKNHWTTQFYLYRAIKSSTSGDAEDRSTFDRSSEYISCFNKMHNIAMGRAENMLFYVMERIPFVFHFLII